MTVARNKGFTQVCVWPGIILTPDQVTGFTELMLEHFDVRTQYLEEVKTNPDIDDNGHRVHGTGGRNDLVFAVHDDDVGKFAVPRLGAGIRWIEDALASCNNTACLYPSNFSEYMSWSTESVDA